MAKIVGVRFRNAGKTYYFDPCDQFIPIGAGVIVETAQGVEYGSVSIATREMPDEQIVNPLKKIIRVATEADKKKLADIQAREKRAVLTAAKKAEQYKLEMSFVRVEMTFDGAKAIFYFTSEGRVDFRELVKDLAVTFRTRIELRQIGVRDETKMLGGLGPCGQPCCCNRFLNSFQPVSIKMAKEQGLSLNPTKISGLCGRLMCCLKYEQSRYEQTHRRMPSVGSTIRTPVGEGRVQEVNVLKETVKVTVAVGDQIEMHEYPYEELLHPEAMPEKTETAEDNEAMPEIRPRRERRDDRPREKRDGQREGKEKKRPDERKPAEAKKPDKPEESTEGGEGEKTKNNNRHRRRGRGHRGHGGGQNGQKPNNGEQQGGNEA